MSRFLLLGILLAHYPLMTASKKKKAGHRKIHNINKSLKNQNCCQGKKVAGSKTVFEGNDNDPKIKALRTAYRELNTGLSDSQLEAKDYPNAEDKALFKDHLEKREKKVRENLNKAIDPNKETFKEGDSKWEQIYNALLESCCGK